MISFLYLNVSSTRANLYSLWYYVRDYTLKWLQAHRTIHLIRNTADEEDGKEEPGQDTEQLPEDGSADSDEEEGDERLDQNPSN
ncbi:MAG: hypothetical protein QN716_09095 [Nitrososphaeraceae archaeon]|jgi:hypothetical protein|nr:hypothetical protein [Nitrososphaeraceae archaeon]